MREKSTAEQQLQDAKDLAYKRAQDPKSTGLAIWIAFKIWYLRHHDIQKHIAIDLGDVTINFNSKHDVIHFINGFN